ncbi:reverse transcriptase/maturase family protein [Thiotrichales bacterium HSG1]|nr:reverse transcriptase/maturase family protein [Thiotrichales bacterium HSG1]
MLDKFLPFLTKPQIGTSSHLTAVNFEPNHLLKQVIADNNINSALTWLQDSSSKQDSDIWDYSRSWEEHKTSLIKRILSGQFEFQIATEIENAEGEFFEIRCAEDRLLIRAISQVLTPVFNDNIAAECVHLAGRGGTQQAVKETHAQLLSQPKAQVMKSDVKGYYANVDHRILLDQFATLLPNETELQRLVWMFLQRTVERGGNYRDITKGLPLGASISPQLGALYLSPLDALFSTDDKHFYRRYMDDWVIFCKNSWDLRKTVKKVYTVLHALRVEVAPDKTYIGKASKGFDFLGKRILPIGILPSASALSRLQKNTVRLYEKGASKKRIELYWKRWLLWASLGLGGHSPLYAAPCGSPEIADSGQVIDCKNGSGGIMTYVVYGLGDGAVAESGNYEICARDGTDCSSTLFSLRLSPGTYIFKNTSEGSGDFYYGVWGGLGVGFTSAGAGIPSVSRGAPFGMNYIYLISLLLLGLFALPSCRVGARKWITELKK